MNKIYNNKEIFRGGSMNDSSTRVFLAFEWRIKDIIKYLESIGLLSKEITEGRVYPYTESATTVLEVLKAHLERLGVNIKCNFEVNKITLKSDKYCIYNKNERNSILEADYLVFACGGCAAPVLGSNGSGYALLKPFKVKTTDLYPGLVGIKSDITILKILNGLRFKCNVSIIEKNKPVLDVDFAINMSLPGIIAHESAVQGGMPMEIPLV